MSALTRCFRLPALGVLSLIILAACQDTPNSVATPRPQLQAAILDAAHDAAYARLYFLPPMVRQPTYSGVFDAAAYPNLAVTICRWNGSACVGAPVATYVAGTGANALRLDTEGEKYSATWHARAPDVSVGPHRLSVLLAGVMIGGADIRVVARQQDLNSVPASDIGHVLGRTLPIHFRVEQAAQQPATVATVTVEPATASIVAGETQQFTATARDAAGNVLTGRAVTWSSSDATIASINNDGLAAGHTRGDVAIAALIEGVSGTAALSVRMADLTVSAVDVPARVRKGETLNVAATIENAGNADAAATDVRIRVLAEGTTTEVASTTVAQPAVAAGGTTTINAALAVGMEWPPSVVVEVTTDAASIVSESNETNNTTTSSAIAVTIPDLTVGTITVPASVVRGEALNVDAVIQNAGSADAAATDVRLRVLNAATGAEVASATIAQPAIAAGASANVATSFTSAMSWPAFVTIEVATDFGASVAESDESNNAGVSTQVAITIADLTVANVNVPPSVAKGSALDVEATINNIGSAAAGATDVRFRVLDATTYAELAATTMAQAAVAAGASLTVATSFMTAFPWPASVIVEVTTDAGASINEADEANNIATSAAVTLTIADLAVGAIAVPPSVPKGGTLNVSATIQNVGTADAAATNVRFRVIAAGTSEQLASSAVAQAAIAAGGSLTVAASFSAEQSWPASVQVEVTTDLDAAVAEADEANNTALSAGVMVTIPDLQLQSITLSSTSVVLRCALGIQVLVRNSGTGDAAATDLRVSLKDAFGVVFATTTVAQPAVAAGTETTLNASFTVDQSWPAEFAVFAETDAGSAVPEGDETNNSRTNSGGSVQARTTVPTGYHRMWICGSNTLWTDASNWEPSGVPLSTENVFIPNGVAQYPVLTGNTSVVNLAIENAARLDIGSFTLTASGNVLSGLMVGTGTLNMTGAAKTLGGNVPALLINGSIALSENATAASVVINGGRSLNLSSYGLEVARDLTVATTSNTTKHLVMTSSFATLAVGGRMQVGATTQLDAGEIRLRGGFVQTGAGNAMTPTGTLVVFDGTTPQTVRFDHATTSWFGDVEVRSPAVDFVSNVRVTRQLVVTSTGVLTQSAGSTFYTTRVPEERANGVYRVPSSIIDGSVVMVKNITLGHGDADFVVNGGRSLNLNGHTLVLGGALTVASTSNTTDHIVMTTGTPRLEVGGTMTVGATTQLDVGSIVLRGNFVQTGAGNAMTPTGTKVIFDGTALQTVRFDHATTSWFADVEVRNAAVDFISHVRVTRQLVVTSTGVLRQSAGSTFYTALVPEELSSGNYRVPTSVMDGTVVMVRNITLGHSGANFVVNGGRSLNLNGHTLTIGGGFTVASTSNTTKHIIMATGAPVLNVDDMTVGATTQLDAGTVVVRGNFVQTGAGNALTPTGTRFVFAGSGPQTVSFAHAATSWFADVEVRTPAAVNGVDFISDARVTGQLVVADGALMRQTNGGTYYTTRLPDPGTGRYEVPASIVDGTVVMTRNLVWPSPVSNLIVNGGRSLDLAGFELAIAGNATVASTSNTTKHLIMTQPTGTFIIGGDMTVGATTQLSDGVIMLQGNFVQTGAGNAVTPSGTRFVFSGAGAQTVRFDHAATSWFADVEVRTPAATPLDFISHVRVTGQLTVASGARVTQSNGATFYTTRLPDPASGSYEVPTSVVDGTVVMTHNLRWPSPLADIVVNGGRSLTLSGYELAMNGDFTVASTSSTVKHLVMTSAMDRLRVGGRMTLGAATLLTAGEVILHGGFTQTGAGNSITAAGTRFAFEGPNAQTVRFDHATTSWFDDVQVRASAVVDFISHVRVAGELVVDGTSVLTQSAGSTFYTTRVPEEQASGVYRVPTSVMDGTVVMVKDITLAWPSSNIFVNGGRSLNLSGHSLRLAGGFTVASTSNTTKHVVMTSGSPVLDVGRTLTLGATTQFDVGQVIMRGDFHQTGAGNSLTPTGTRFVFDGSTTQSVRFDHAATSFFGAVDIRTGAAVSLASHVRMKGNLDLDGSLSVPSGITLTVDATLYFAGALTNNGVVNVGSCVHEGGTFSGTGNNPCA